MMKRLVIGILAHVDAGKTTLSEGLLYQGGQLRRLGRVDHQDAFLDTNTLERERGITIFSKQARLPFGETEFTLLDTPGHVDFSAEMERTLQVLDYAILVINGSDGVQGHTLTLWRLLARYQIPTFLFLNKMDLAGTDRGALLDALRRQLHEGCVDFDPAQPAEVLQENIAVCDEGVLNHYLETASLSDEDIASLIRHRRLFPCYFGSALKLDGITEFLQGLDRYTRAPLYPDAFGAKVFKISRDPQGLRLTHMKITGGQLRVKDVLSNRPASGEDGDWWEEKVDQVRLYSGSQFQTAEQAPAGTVCVVTGLTQTMPGQGLGIEANSHPPVLEPVLTYRLLLPEAAPIHTALQQLRQLAEEDPQLHLLWDQAAREIRVQLMGPVQVEVLRRLLRDRFGLEAEFDAGSIIYKETIRRPVEGIGHFEPLRHYAEVHLLLEPLPLGSGLEFASACSEDMLDRSWQRLVLTHLAEKEHVGVLTGSPITDLRITLVAGRAHLKHTEGGDFRQATYRAVRHGLKCADSVLLEPWYELRLELPAPQVGRAMSDLQRMGGELQPPETMGELAVITGSAPVAALGGYALEVASYTRGQGKLFCTPCGYRPCPEQEAVAASIGYDSERDTENPADSVFCEHGAGVVVKWDQVRARAHVDSGLCLDREPDPREPAPVPSRRPGAYASAQAADEELMAIFERTYGPIRRRDLEPPPRPQRPEPSSRERKPRPPQDSGPEYLLVDGYNIMFAWDELRELARDSLDAARQRLMDLMCNYQGFRQCRLILVFDAYRVPRGVGEVVRYHNIHVVYTKEAETADSYIEKTTYELSRKNCRVRVATSDNVEQLIILGHGALRLSAQAFHAEVEQAAGHISALLERQNSRTIKSQPLKAALERAQHSDHTSP